MLLYDLKRAHAVTLGSRTLAIVDAEASDKPGWVILHLSQIERLLCREDCIVAIKYHDTKLPEPLPPINTPWDD